MTHNCVGSTYVRTYITYGLFLNCTHVPTLSAVVYDYAECLGQTTSSPPEMWATCHCSRQGSGQEVTQGTYVRYVRTIERCNLLKTPATFTFALHCMYSQFHVACLIVGKWQSKLTNQMQAIPQCHWVCMAKLVCQFASHSSTMGQATWNQLYIQCKCESCWCHSLEVVKGNKTLWETALKLVAYALLWSFSYAVVNPGHSCCHFV